MQKILILGSKGMLGQELVKLFSKVRKYKVVAWDKEDVDVTDIEALKQKVTAEEPTIILNAVAYNAVDLCEEIDEEYRKAKKLNTAFPGELAKIAHKTGAILVHYSSDYVFDGENPKGYTEKDTPNPLSNYGKTKLGGEEEIMKNSKKHYIIRLSKLFGIPASGENAKRSFFDVMLQKGREGGPIKVVDGEVSHFTYAPDLALATKKLLEKRFPYGIYHLSNEGACTWYEAVQELFTLAKIKAEVEPVGPDAFPRPARRPASSILVNTRFSKLRNYKEALKEYLQNI